MAEPIKLAEVINRLSDRCENCGYGLRHKDREGVKKWCERCIEVYYRKEALKREKAEKTILDLVGARYLEAILGDLNTDIREKLLNLGDRQDVFMFGLVGVGKTYAMAALIRRYVYLGYVCQRINFNDFCVQVRSTFSPVSKVTAWEMIEPYKELDMLFIDDLGLRSTPESQFAYDTLFSILNKRMERVLPVFITSNKSIEQLGRSFDDRIASRLQTALIIEVTGKDRRKNKAAQKEDV